MIFIVQRCVGLFKFAPSSCFLARKMLQQELTKGLLNTRPCSDRSFLGSQSPALAVTLAEAYHLLFLAEAHLTQA